jgi:hypothetical protein
MNPCGEGNYTASQKPEHAPPRLLEATVRLLRVDVDLGRDRRAACLSAQRYKLALENPIGDVADRKWSPVELGELISFHRAAAV